MGEAYFYYFTCLNSVEDCHQLKSAVVFMPNARRRGCFKGTLLSTKNYSYVGFAPILGESFDCFGWSRWRHCLRSSVHKRRSRQEPKTYSANRVCAESHWHDRAAIHESLRRSGGFSSQHDCRA